MMCHVLQGVRAFFWEKKAVQKRLIGDADWVVDLSRFRLFVLMLQRAVWGNEKARSRQNGASSICRLPAFSDCCAICDPLRGPAQTWVGCLPNLFA